MKILLLLLVSFSLIANHHNDRKQVTIAAKLLESSPEGNVLSAPTMSMLTDTRGVIAVEQEGSEGEKQGFRMAVHPSVSANGILLEGYAVYGTYDPKKIDKQTEIFGLFSRKAKLPIEEESQPDWADTLELSGSFRINGKAYGAFSTTDGSFWLEEGKGASGYRLLKMDLSKSQPRALLEKDGKQAWLGLRAGESSSLRNLEQPLEEGGSLFIKEVKSGEKVTIPVVGLDGKKYDFEMVVTSN
ncbi:MAG: hypothetical protein EBS13_02665 [Verrucomicrobia bacterium]|nr:hypothetical protein [Verrucomicrobiota bacterium]